MYLACIVTKNMSDEDDVDRQIGSIYAKGNMLVNTFKCCSDEVKIELFKAYCSNLYCNLYTCGLATETLNITELEWRTMIATEH